MMVLRRAQNSDLKAIHFLAEQAGIGLTTLPNDKTILEQRLHWSCDSFAKAIHAPSNEFYLFVLQDSDTDKIIGTAGIEAALGHELPFYSYKISKRTRICHSLDIRSDYEVLSLVNDNQGRSELCTLFLESAARHSYAGLLLSRGRFLFMAQFPMRFADIVIAEMRGISNDWGESPFWNAVGYHFFHMNFAQADALTISTNKQFIADLMPRNPVYLALLPKEAQAVVGKPHQSTLPAMKILLREGFRYNGYVDIFDAGPTIEAPKEAIRTLALSKIMTVKTTSDTVHGKRFLLANTKLDFRATVDHVLFNLQTETCTLSKETATLLEVSPGDCVRLSPLHLEESNAYWTTSS